MVKKDKLGSGDLIGAFQFGRNARPRKNKFKAIRTAGFASKLEYAVHAILVKRQLAGEISDIKCQQAVILIPGPPTVQIKWKVDFSFIEDGKRCYAEAKGIETSDYKLKMKLWRSNPPAKLYIYKGSYVKPKITEIVEMKETIIERGSGAV